MTDVLAPCAGDVVPVTQAPDPVFAAEMVGAGVAVVPEPGTHTVVAPIAGRLVKVHPHAFVILDDAGVGILVHLGLDTVRLRGEGFTLHAAEQDQVTAGQPVVAWDTAPAIAAGYSTMVPVVLMDSPAGTVKPALQKAEAGDVLFTV